MRGTRSGAEAFVMHAAVGFDDESGQQARRSGLPHVAWGGGPRTSVVIPMEAWAAKQKAAEETASRSEGPDPK